MESIIEYITEKRCAICLYVSNTYTRTRVHSALLSSSIHKTSLRYVCIRHFCSAWWTLKRGIAHYVCGRTHNSAYLPSVPFNPKLSEWDGEEGRGAAPCIQKPSESSSEPNQPPPTCPPNKSPFIIFQNRIIFHSIHILYIIIIR